MSKKNELGSNLIDGLPKLCVTTYRFAACFFHWASSRVKHTGLPSSFDWLSAVPLYDIQLCLAGFLPTLGFLLTALLQLLHTRVAVFVMYVIVI